jgi:hypothetical protein
MASTFARAQQRRNASPHLLEDQAEISAHQDNGLPPPRIKVSAADGSQ